MPARIGLIQLVDDLLPLFGGNALEYLVDLGSTRSSPSLDCGEPR